MNKTTKRNIEIKKSLCEVFNRKDVRVLGGRGTAYGWVEIKVETDRKSDCTCNIKIDKRWRTNEEYKYRDVIDMNRLTYFCDSCKKIRQETEEKARKAIKASKQTFGTYTADDGYNTERDEMLLDIEVRI